MKLKELVDTQITNDTIDFASYIGSTQRFFIRYGDYELVEPKAAERVELRKMPISTDSNYGEFVVDAAWSVIERRVNTMLRNQWNDMQGQVDIAIAAYNKKLVEALRGIKGPLGSYRLAEILADALEGEK